MQANSNRLESKSLLMQRKKLFRQINGLMTINKKPCRNTKINNFQKALNLQSKKTELKK